MSDVALSPISKFTPGEGEKSQVIMVKVDPYIRASYYQMGKDAFRDSKSRS